MPTLRTAARSTLSRPQRIPALARFESTTASSNNAETAVIKKEEGPDAVAAPVRARHEPDWNAVQDYRTS